MGELFPIFGHSLPLPIPCAIDRETANLFVETANSDTDDPRESKTMHRGCVFVFENSPIVVHISQPRFAILQASWTAWKEIEESWLDRFNCELKCAVSKFYSVSSDSVKTYVKENPYHHIPRDDLISGFDTAVNLWYGTKRYEIMNRYTNELIKGQKSFLKWRFYLVRWRGLPRYEEVTEGLRSWLYEYFWNPHHIIFLLMHLDEGGERFSEDTKRVLKYIRILQN